ncbi:hypothetical protein M2122_000129 [Polynucleobacter sphagniphilus]|nr:hypothetical protein [Polynucleobacter sphagniphilus]
MKNIFLALTLFFSFFNIYAQSCSGGTTTISTDTGTVLGMNNNSCAVIESQGSVIRVQSNDPLNSTQFNIQNNGTIGNSIFTFDNAGVVGISVDSSVLIPALVNTGTINPSINGLNSSAYGVWLIDATSSITSLTNSGNISPFASGSGSRAVGVLNNGLITTFNNAQGGNGLTPATTAVTYTGNLPTYYNIIINSPSNYGQLAVTSGAGATTFGIYGGGVAGVAASSLNKGTYSGVLSGVAASNLTAATKGNYNGFTWSLSETDTINGIWSLLVSGASTADTQQSLINTSAALQNTFTLQNTVLANSFSYDCNVFGANNVCISAGGRNTQVSAANGLNSTSALLIAAYRVMPSVRVGAYADQNLSVNNAGSAVNLGNNTPLIGLFGAWNERLDGTGTEVKVSAAYGQKNTTVTRSVVGTSEAGSGSSQLNSQGAQLTAKYGFGVVENVIVSPYVGVRYTQNNMNGYSEQATSSVTAPLTYSAINTNATTALVGVGTSYKIIPAATVFASAGVETDTNTSNGTYSATGVSGLTPINFNANPVKTRPTATIGAYYDVEKNQRIGITGIYRQEPYQAVQTTTVMATYTVGL